MTSDAELRTRIKRLWAGQRPEESSEWLDDRQAARDLVEAFYEFCDDQAHDDKEDDMFEIESWQKLRKQAAALYRRTREWDGEL